MSDLPPPAIHFDEFTAPLLGLPVSDIWRGYGSAIFLEFGVLSEGRKRRNGTLGNPRGEWTLMIEWSWWIEGKRLIWCGSWSDEERWPRAFQHLMGAKVRTVEVFGRIREIDLGLSNGLHVVSLMTAEGNPEWSLCKQTPDGKLWLSVKSGRLRVTSGSGEETIA